MKILVAVSSVTVVAVAVGLLSISRLGSVEHRTAVISDSSMASMQALGDVRAHALQSRVDLGNHAVSQDGQTMAAYEKAIQADDAALDASLAAYRTSDPTALPQVEQFVELWEQYRQVRDAELLPASRANDETSYQQIRDDKTREMTARGFELLDQAEEAENADAHGNAQAAADTVADARQAILSSSPWACCSVSASPPTSPGSSPPRCAPCRRCSTRWQAKT